MPKTSQTTNKSNLTAVPPAAPASNVSHEERERLIAERAYQLAAERGFAPGAELEDWLAAEREIDSQFPRE